MKPNHYSKSVIISLLFFPLGLLYGYDSKVKHIGKTNLLAVLILPLILMIYIDIYIDVSLEQFMLLLVGVNGVISSVLIIDFIGWRNRVGRDIFEGFSDAKIVYFIAPLLFFFSILSFLVILLVEAKVFDKNGLNMSSFYAMNLIVPLIIIATLAVYFFIRIYVFIMIPKGTK